MSAQHRTRPARSNSLQRMLELERRYMLERMQQSLPQTSKLTASTPAAPTTSPKKMTPSSPARNTIQARRMDTQTQTEVRPGAKTSREKPALPPLVINVSSTKLTADVTGTGSEKEALANAPSNINMSPDKKAVSFDVPPNDEDDEDRRSVCQSPSWEAYGRRKKEKKEEKKDMKKELKKDHKKDPKKDLRKDAKKDPKKDQKEKKEQKQDKDGAGKTALLKKKRLSKQPPPTSSTLSLEIANRMVSAPTKEKQRPSSALGLSSPAKDDTPARPSRPRSGSFTSLIRSPFESRRASFDAAPPAESGFIGGIKLEIQRNAAQQQPGRDPAQKSSESDIHPVLRTANLTTAVLKSPPPPARPNGPDPQRRAYPPITRHAKSRSLVSPTAPEMPDLGTIDKWRAFVGLKSTPKQGTAGTKDGSQFEGPKKPVVVVVSQVSESSPKTAVAADAAANVAVLHNDPPQPAPRNSSNVLANPSKMPVPLDQHVKEMTAPRIEADNHMTPINHLPNNVEPIQANPTAPNNLPRTSRSMLPSMLPEPPRRSPKRNSFVSLDGSVSSLSPNELLAPPALPDSSRESFISAHETRFPPAGVPVSTTRSIQPGSHPNPSMISMDSSGSRNNELATSGASLRPSTPRDGTQAEASQKPDGTFIPTWEDIQTSVMRAIDTKISLSPIRKSHSFLRDDSDFTVRRLGDESLPVTSSDDSSDDFHSPSMPGTPDTSRPQSEKGLPPLFPDMEKRFMGSSGEPRVRNASRSPAREPVGHRLEAVSSHGSLPPNSARSSGNYAPAHAPAHAAAGKAMNQGPSSQQPRPGAHPRAHSEADVTTGANFLPKLKHQSLKPMDKTALKQAVPASPRLSSDEKSIPRGQPPTAAPWPASYLEEARKATPLAPPPQTLKSPQVTPKITPPPSIRSQPNSSTSDVTTRSLRHTPGSTVGSSGSEPIAKMFVECCACRFYHDMPSNLYEAMANPEAVIRLKGNVGFAGSISMTVKCPWCNHEMSTKCCAGFAAMVHIKERLH